MTEEETTALASRWKTKLAAQTINFRGLFAGGTLCTEVKLILKNAGIPLVLEPAEGADLRHGIALGEGNIILDLGEDIFTVGRPHPMIDSTLRAEYIKSAGKDKNVKILALDFVGGYGSNDDPAGSLAEAIVAAKRDDLLVVASFCGTEGDPQKRSEQIAKLQELGVQVFPTAARAAEFVVKVMK
jgi:FdrA protein